MASTAEHSTAGPLEVDKGEVDKRDVDKGDVDKRDVDKGEDSYTKAKTTEIRQRKVGGSQQQSIKTQDTADNRKDLEAQEELEGRGKEVKQEQEGSGDEQEGDKAKYHEENEEEGKGQPQFRYPTPEPKPLSDIKVKGKYTTLVALALSIIAAILLLYFYNTESPKDRAQDLRKFTNSIEEMKVSFPSQTTRFWRILRNRGNAHLKNPSPKKPLVLMLIAPPSAYDVLECIVTKIARSLQPEGDEDGISESIYGKEFQKYESLDEGKKVLDETLERRLQKRGTVIVFNLDQLPSKSALLFYQYCDNENAPYKQAAIIFTVRLPDEPDPSLESAKAEFLVTKYLIETWSKQDYQVDNTPPLVSRVTDTVVLVEKESKETIERNCAA